MSSPEQCRFAFFICHHGPIYWLEGKPVYFHHYESTNQRPFRMSMCTMCEALGQQR